MTHEETRKKVLLLRDGELPDGDKAVVAEHLVACASCRELRTATDGIGDAFASEPVPEPSESFISAVMGRLEEEKAPVWDGIELPFRWWAPVFATGVAGLVLLLASPDTRQQPVTVETLLVVSAGISTDESAETPDSDIADMLGMSLEGL